MYYDILLEPKSLKSDLKKIINFSTLESFSTYPLAPTMPESGYKIMSQDGRMIHFEPVWDDVLRRYVTQVDFFIKPHGIYNAREFTVNFPDLELFNDLNTRYIEIEFAKNKKKILDTNTQARNFIKSFKHIRVK